MPASKTDCAQQINRTGLRACARPVIGDMGKKGTRQGLSERPGMFAERRTFCRPLGENKRQTHRWNGHVRPDSGVWL